MESRFLDLHKSMMDEGVMLYFNGPFSQRVIETLGGRLREEFATVHSSMGLKVFSIFVELAQNVIRHAYAGEAEEAESGAIMVSRKEGGFHIWCGNLVANGEVAGIAEQLDEIARLDKDGLKDLYKQKRQKDRDTSRRGAGLGLIEIARKVSAPLDYAVEPINDETSFFSLTATVKNKE